MEYKPPTMAITKAKGNKKAKNNKITAKVITSPKTIKKKYTHGLPLTRLNFIWNQFFYLGKNLIV
jgi:hypothetical protein